jgi:hypothetical protein
MIDSWGSQVLCYRRGVRDLERRGGAQLLRRLRRRSAVDAGENPQDIEKLLAEIDALSHEHDVSRDPELARRILQLRHQAGLKLMERPAPEPPEYPAPAFDQLQNESKLPDVPCGQVTPELLRAAILRSGCLLIRGFIDQEDVPRLVDGIDRAWEARDAHAAGGSTNSAYYEEFEPDARFDLAWDRGVMYRSESGLIGPDCPPAMLDVIESFDRAGLGSIAGGYLGEHPAISVNKCVLRRVNPNAFQDELRRNPGSKHSHWHQDGAFLGEVRALNVWLSLSRCGDVAPGLDIVPRRLDHVLATGTEGARFDWSASRAVAEEAAGDIGIVRPIFEPGDALLFDELLLHSTAIEPGMTSMRHAVECWFFGPSGFPPNYAPLAF